MHSNKLVVAFLALVAFITLSLALPTTEVVHKIPEGLGHRLGRRDISCQILPHTCQVFTLSYSNSAFAMSFTPQCELVDRKFDWKSPTNLVNGVPGQLVELNKFLSWQFVPKVTYHKVNYGSEGADVHDYYCENGENDDRGVYCMIYYPC